MYKILHSLDQYSIQFGNSNIPLDPANRDYQQFIENVAEQGYGIVEGPDVVQPSYAELRAAEYPSLHEQEDMKYWDEINGTTVWRDTITAIKERHPKIITGGTTIGPIPAWVQEAVNAYNSNS